LDSTNPKSPQTALQQKLKDALDARDALEDILHAIGESPGELEAIFDVILEKALRLCHAQIGVVFLYDEGLFEAVGMRGLPDAYRDWFQQAGQFEPTQSTGYGRIVNQHEIVHIEDVKSEEAYINRDPLRVATVELGKARTLMSVPLIVQERLVGVFAVYRQEVRKFSDSELALAQTFAKNAAIAIEHTNLLVRVRNQAKELEALNQNLNSQVAEQVEELSRLGRLKRFLSPEVAEMIVSSGDDSLLHSHRRQVAALFCDLRGFTAFAESVEPEEAIEVLQIYHHDMGQLIAMYGGTIDHRAGDGIMVIFNDPILCDNPAHRAVEMAIEMRVKMQILLGHWQKRDYKLGFGVGIAFGFATLGMVGDDTRSDYTANGTVINLAARLCDDAKENQILVTQRTLSEVEGSFEIESLGTREFKGITRPQKVFDVKSASFFEE
jgi:class 3 adenylate cyclase